MFSHCIFCHSDLGRNAVIEHFPVGRRLAFDAAKGRLWAVCRRCERWNLTPLEERWEAIEKGERLFRATRSRVSTDNIGLARLREGLELVRIGRPLRPELAAWRYGDQFGRRRRRNAIAVGGGVAAVGAIAAGAPLVLGMAGAMSVLNLAGTAMSVWGASRGRITLPHPDGGRVVVHGQQVGGARLVSRGAGDPHGWALEIPYMGVITDDMSPLQRFWRASSNMSSGQILLQGPAAEHAAALILPRINRAGASRERVRDAVAMIEDVGEPARIWAHAASRTREWGAQQYWGDTGAIRFLPAPVRLALEMAAHEDSERAALEHGELARLEQAWRDAEEIAAIADTLLVPGRVREKLAEMREKSE